MHKHQLETGVRICIEDKYKGAGRLEVMTPINTNQTPKLAAWIYNLKSKDVAIHNDLTWQA